MFSWFWSLICCTFVWSFISWNYHMWAYPAFFISCQEVPTNFPWLFVWWWHGQTNYLALTCVRLICTVKIFKYCNFTYPSVIFRNINQGFGLCTYSPAEKYFDYQTFVNISYLKKKNILLFSESFRHFIINIFVFPLLWSWWNPVSGGEGYRLQSLGLALNGCKLCKINW